jgi:hypothetical protein
MKGVNLVALFLISLALTPVASAQDSSRRFSNYEQAVRSTISQYIGMENSLVAGIGYEPFGNDSFIADRAWRSLQPSDSSLASCRLALINFEHLWTKSRNVQSRSDQSFLSIANDYIESVEACEGILKRPPSKSNLRVEIKPIIIAWKNAKRQKPLPKGTGAVRPTQRENLGEIEILDVFVQRFANNLQGRVVRILAAPSSPTQHARIAGAVANAFRQLCQLDLVTVRLYRNDVGSFFLDEGKANHVELALAEWDRVTQKDKNYLMIRAMDRIASPLQIEAEDFYYTQLGRYNLRNDEKAEQKALSDVRRQYKFELVSAGRQAQLGGDDLQAAWAVDMRDFTTELVTSVKKTCAGFKLP